MIRKRLSIKTVYCNPEFEHEVASHLHILFLELDAEHPEWEFDVDESWDEVDAVTGENPPTDE